MNRDMRLLPTAVLGWLVCLVAIRVGMVWGGVLVLFALSVTAVAAARLWHRPGGRHRRATAGRAAATVVLSGVVVAMLAGWASARANVRADAVAPFLRESIVATLRIDSEARQVSGGRVLVQGTWLDATSEGRPDAPPTHLGVRVTILGDKTWLATVVGSEVSAVVAVSPSDPGEDSAALLVPRGEPRLVARAPPLAAAIASLRAGLLSASAGLDAQARGLVPGIALGDDRALSPTLDAALRAVSLTHITAVSGAHVALVLGLALAGLCWLPAPARAVIGAVVLVALVLLVHPAASVLRAAVMGAVLLLGLLLNRPRAALPALWTSVVVLLVADPWLAGSFGFVLSVCATAGLLVLARPLADRLSRHLPRPLALLLAVPVAAQAACMPALALLQPQAPVYGVLANVLAALAVPPATVLGLAATLIHPALPGVAVALVMAASWATAWIASVALWCAALPLAQVPWWVAVVAIAAPLSINVVRRWQAGLRASLTAKADSHGLESPRS